jgi:hypothetical protein
MTLVLLFIVIYYLFINSHQTEKFAGVGSENPFSNLTCLHEDPNNTNSTKHIFKVSPSLNFKGGHYTYHKLQHPDRLSKTDGTKYITYDDIVETSDKPKCNDGEFSTYFVKKIRDENSKARTLFNKINAGQSNNNKSTWQQHECGLGELTNNSHWCGKIHKTISDNIDKICSTKPGDVPANYCSNFKDDKLGLNAYININDSKDSAVRQLLKDPTVVNQLKQVNQINYLQQKGADSITQKIRSVGAIPQEITLDNGEYHCFKDNYGNKIDSTGALCYNTDASKNIKPYAPTDKNGNIMCNPGDILQSSICKNASGVSYPTDLSDINNPKCTNPSDAIDSSGNTWSICSGIPLFDKIDATVSSKTFGTILNKTLGNDKKCTPELVKNGKGPTGTRGFCVRAPTVDELNNIKKTQWYNNFTDQFASASS